MVHAFPREHIPRFVLVMVIKNRYSHVRFRLPLLTPLLALANIAAAQTPGTIDVDASRSVRKVSPTHYGLMTEEINFSYDGGLYAELVRNRAFLDNAKSPDHWSVVSGTNAAAAIVLDPSQPLNEAIRTSLRLDVTAATKSQQAGIANSGYWGIPVQPDMRYRASFFAKAALPSSGPITVSLQSEDGGTIYASGKVDRLTSQWQQYQVSFKTGKVIPTSKARLVLTTDRPGTTWFSLVSLFPPTWKDRPNGFRKDLMQMLIGMKPKFLRFPGGNYLEGNTIDNRFDWKKTLGPLAHRPGHLSPWGYRSTDGMGLLEFLLWCEDMGAEPVLAVYAGYSLRGELVQPGTDLDSYVQEALEEIEYVTGDVNTRWGAQRAKDGHPKPFTLRYVEIGNEDFFDKSGSYDNRFAQFYDAIKAKYANLKVISSVGFEQPEQRRVHSRKPDTVDEHYYRSADEFVRMSPGHYDNYDRSGPEIFVGEWAAHEDPKIVPWSPQARTQPPTPSMKAALGDAAFMTAMERNSDLVVMQCYAPLLVNVNPGARQWRPDLIGYDALRSYGSPSYYAFQMFSQNVGDEILAISSNDSPIQSSATRDSKTGRIFLKLVNPQPTPQSASITLRGAGTVAATANAIILTADPTATNTIESPTQVVPTTSKVSGIRSSFIYTVPPNSITVLKLESH